MTTIDCITALFCRIDDRTRSLSKHPKAVLWPSEIVTQGVCCTRSRMWATVPSFGGWHENTSLFPHLPEPTRLFRQFKTYQQWTLLFLAPPTLLGWLTADWIEVDLSSAKGAIRGKSVGKGGVVQPPQDRGRETVVAGQSSG